MINENIGFKNFLYRQIIADYQRLIKIRINHYNANFDRYIKIDTNQCLSLVGVFCCIFLPHFSPDCIT